MSPNAWSPARPLASADPAKVGPYRLVGRLGAGGMGTVYAARGRGSSLVAVKTVHPELAADRGFRARFRREVELVRRVSSPFTPRFVAADTAARVPWLATEYVPGPTLEQRVRGEGPLGGGALTALAAGTLEALRGLHAQGVVHRDLKPANVVLSPAGPRVLDFGIARALDGTALTRTGGLAGSSGWIAPERYREGLSTTGADVFSWGALMAYAATGRPPFGSGEPQVVARRVLREEPDLAGVPQPLMPLAAAALVKDPARRPGAADLLARCSGGGREAATRVVEREWRGFEDPVVPSVPGRRRSTAAAAAGAALLLVAAVGTVAAVRVLDVGGAGEGESPVTASEAGEGGAPTGSGDGDEGSEDAVWPPEAARNSGVNVGFTVEARARTRPDLVDLDAVADRGRYGSFTIEPGPSASDVRLSALTRSDRGALLIDVEFLSMGTYRFTEGHLSIVTRDGVFPPSIPEREIGGSPDGGVAFVDAPDRGLLVFAAPDYEEGVRGEPPVGLCYDLMEDRYSTVYEDCV